MRDISPGSSSAASSARSSKTSFARSRSDACVDYAKDPRVDAYIDALPEWQQEICRRVRDLVHAADPEVAETIKRTRQPYFVLDGNICALLAAKDHVNVFLYDGAIVPDPEGIITAGHDNKTARTVAFREGEPINAHALSGDVQADHRQQPRRRLAQAQAADLRRRSGTAPCGTRSSSPTRQSLRRATEARSRLHQR